MKRRSNPSVGFSLIELLTVIAIIALLAALIFPVFNRVRENARQSTCMSNMHSVVTALKQYREDFNKYPPVLYGFAESSQKSGSYQKYYTGSEPGPVAMHQLTYLPLVAKEKYIREKEKGFFCPDNLVQDLAAVTTAIYPPTAGTDVAGQTAQYTQLVLHSAGVNPGTTGAVYYYKQDALDIGPQVDANGNKTGKTELHYSLDWTGLDPASDTLRNQLKFRDAPSDQTVVTWCTHHAATYGSNVVPVAMLTGSVKAVPIRTVVEKGPLKLTP